MPSVHCNSGFSAGILWKCDLYLGAFFCICKSNLAGVTDVVLVERESDRVSKSPHHH